MIYLLERKLSNTKSVYIALIEIYGISVKTSFLICNKLGFLQNLKIKHLSNKQITKIISNIGLLNKNFASDLKKLKLLSKKKLIIIKSYKGSRLLKGLPVRGQ